ncbi:MAG: hypothetical protein OSB29_04480, partial [Verrucomicrobiota bacterium]|nr:hypothetical protein [Verrucomicrobiota bacterium]
MKIIVTLLAVAAISITGTYVFFSNQKSTDRSERTETASTKHEEQLASLRTEINTLKARKPQVVTHEVVVPGAATGSPQEVLEYLKQIDLSNEDRRT